MFLKRLGKTHAPEFPSRLTWLNSSSLAMKKLRGKVVLIDFWTYSCVNCLRTLPHLIRWHEAYKDKGLVIIGVHTPEFAFESDKSTVSAAVKRLGIPYPVVLDPKYAIWKLYANRYWPHKFLVDHQGVLVYDHIGEGHYAETEHAIQKALQAIGAKDLPAIKPDESIGGGICYPTTHEVYLGFLRGRFGHDEHIVPNEEIAYTSSSAYEEGIPHFHGHFTVAKEYVEHSRQTAGSEYIGLRYSAFSVNLVMETAQKKRASIEIELDGQPLPEDMAGEDVRIQKDGRAVVTVTGARMYRLVDADTYHRGLLKVKVRDAGLRAYAFTFGNCKGM